MTWNVLRETPSKAAACPSLSSCGPLFQWWATDVPSSAVALNFGSVLISRRRRLHRSCNLISIRKSGP